MSLDVHLYFAVDTGGPESPEEWRVFDANYTHNVGRMAEAADLYVPVWHPEDDSSIQFASDLIPHLRRGIAAMEDDPKKFIAMNPANGWGSYETFLPWLREYLQACVRYPKAKIYTST